MDINLIKRQTNSSKFKKLNDVLGKADWDRFRAYAKRIRSLAFDETVAYRSDPDTPNLDPTVIAVLSLHHPFGAAFLPHLRKLSWTTDGSALSMLPFLSGELTELYLEMSTQIPSKANEVFKAIVHRTPSLVTFSLEARVRDINIDISLARWLETTTKLKDLSFPPYYLTPDLIRALGSLPKLKRIEQNIKFAHTSDSTRLLQSLPPGTFPSLIQISFNATLSEARKLLSASQDVGSRLRQIDLHACGDLDSDDVLNFVRCVAENCPLMTNLILDLFERLETGERFISPLEMTMLESLYPCKRLQALEIAYPLPFTFQEDDVERMGRAWPQMFSLDVCPEPDYAYPLSGHMGNSLSILSVFARALPKLRALGLYLNKQEAPPFTGNLYPRDQFKELSELRFGFSPVPKGQLRQVGFYIASLCKNKPVIDLSLSRYYTGTFPNDYEERERAWEKVEDMVHFAMEVKLAGLTSLRETGLH
ncbi:hypothetical protein FRC01_002873 [Tulasnella sp. 417]|nr:hypothetical protein FRC01_002873 [Tulasnella sp. 417]